MNQQTSTTADATTTTTAATTTATPVPVASGSTDTGAFNAGGLVFFGVTAVILIAALVLYLRNRSVAPGAGPR